MNETQSFSEQMRNVPNRISSARLILSFVVFALIPLQLYAAALVVFLIAAGTDWIDGWYARKYNLVTQVGRILDPFCDKITEWIDKSQGRVRADVAHRRLVAMGYRGSERTTRRVVAALKADWVREHRRGYKPWLPEPGLWLQWDYGDGPEIAGVRTQLFCAWLAWSRFRVILPLSDKTLPSVISALDRCFRLIGGIPTYALTDNEKTVTDRHVARVPVRNPQIVAAAHYYGVTIATCVPADPESKGGAEATVRIAKADVVPTAANLLDDYESFDQLEAACETAMVRFNTRVHTMTGEKPVDRLEREHEFLHRVPDEPYTAAFGETRAVSWSSTISFRGARYSVPHDFMGARVWVRVHGDELIITGGCQNVCVRGWRRSLLCDVDSVGEVDGECVEARFPSVGSGAGCSSSLGGDVTHGEIEQFERCFLGREVAPVLGDLPQLVVD